VRRLEPFAWVRRAPLAVLSGSANVTWHGIRTQTVNHDSPQGTPKWLGQFPVDSPAMANATRSTTQSPAGHERGAPVRAPLGTAGVGSCSAKKRRLAPCPYRLLRRIRERRKMESPRRASEIAAHMWTAFDAVAQEWAVQLLAPTPPNQARTVAAEVNTLQARNWLTFDA
jgi:hypothetical protein